MAKTKAGITTGSSANDAVTKSPPSAIGDDVDGDDAVIGDEDVKADNGDSPTTSSPSSEEHQQQQQQHPMAEDKELAVCCGCRPQRRRYRKYSLTSSFKRMMHGSGGRYFDATTGPDAEWRGHYEKDAKGVEDEDSLFFFDAVDRPLGDEEYPLDGGPDAGRYVVRGPALGDYPIVFTTSLQHPAPHVSMEEPASMLRHLSDATLEDDEQRDESVEVWSSEPIQSHKEPSMRLLRIKRRPTMEHSVRLATPRIKIREKGYPGELTVEELDECVSGIGNEEGTKWCKWTTWRLPWLMWDGRLLETTVVMVVVGCIKVVSPIGATNTKY
jgi:hypothetical protein